MTVIQGRELVAAWLRSEPQPDEDEATFGVVDGVPTVVIGGSGG